MQILLWESCVHVHVCTKSMRLTCYQIRKLIIEKVKGATSHSICYQWHDTNDLSLSVYTLLYTVVKYCSCINSVSTL